MGGKDRAVFQWRIVRQVVREPKPLSTPWAQVDERGLMWAPPGAVGGLAGVGVPLSAGSAPAPAPGLPQPQLQYQQQQQPARRR